MAFFCKECKIIYLKKLSNCPGCGGPITEEQLSDESLLNQGFLYHKNHPSSSTSSATSDGINKAPVFSIDSQDALEQLRQDFINSNSRSEHNTETVQQPVQNNNASVPSGNSDNDFFSNVSALEFQINTNNHTPPPVNATQKDKKTTSHQNTAANRPFSGDQDSSPQQRIKTYRPTTPIHIPWRIILYVFLAIVAIIAVVAIWNARYAIINGIFNFILSLLPLALIVGGIVYLIRRIFR